MFKVWSNRKKKKYKNKKNNKIESQKEKEYKNSNNKYYNEKIWRIFKCKDIINKYGFSEIEIISERSNRTKS